MCVVPYIIHDNNQLFWTGVPSGSKQQLMDIVADESKGYVDLTKVEKSELVDKLETHRTTVVKGRCVSAKSQGQDICQTLHHVGVEASLIILQYHYINFVSSYSTSKPTAMSHVSHLPPTAARMLLLCPDSFFATDVTFVP